jgi:hypothetical protein
MEQLEADIVSVPTLPVAGDAKTADSRCYDLQGRQVAHPGKGIYVSGGRKIVVR